MILTTLNEIFPIKVDLAINLLAGMIKFGYGCSGSARCFGAEEYIIPCIFAVLDSFMYVLNRRLSVFQSRHITFFFDFLCFQQAAHFLLFLSNSLPDTRCRMYGLQIA